MLYKKPTVQAVKFLLVKGWSLNKHNALDVESIPLLPKMVCMMKPSWAKKKLTPEQEYALFEPKVRDLTKVEIRSEVRVCPEK